MKASPKAGLELKYLMHLSMFCPRIRGRGATLRLGGHISDLILRGAQDTFLTTVFAGLYNLRVNC